LIISQFITIYFYFKIKKDEKITGLETSSWIEFTVTGHWTIFVFMMSFISE
jgi:hypothetical protein